MHFSCTSKSNWNPFLLQFVSEFWQFSSEFFVHPNVIEVSVVGKKKHHKSKIYSASRYNLGQDWEEKPFSLELGSNWQFWKHRFDFSWERILKHLFWRHHCERMRKALAVTNTHLFGISQFAAFWFMWMVFGIASYLWRALQYCNIEWHCIDYIAFTIGPNAPLTL